MPALFTREGRSAMRIDAFYSDPHYNHKNILKYCPRPFADMDEMREGMIARYNEIVRPNQCTLWMGDCFFGGLKDDAAAIMARLNGHKMLIRGNHDHWPAYVYLEMGFEFVSELGFDIRLGKRIVHVNHYPTKPFHEGDVRYANVMVKPRAGVGIMHGHTHEAVRITPRGELHAGVDAWQWAPAPREELEVLVEQLPCFMEAA